MQLLTAQSTEPRARSFPVKQSSQARELKVTLFSIQLPRDLHINRDTGEALIYQG